MRRTSGGSSRRRRQNPRAIVASNRKQAVPAGMMGDVRPGQLKASKKRSGTLNSTPLTLHQRDSARRNPRRRSHVQQQSPSPLTKRSVFSSVRNSSSKRQNRVSSTQRKLVPTAVHSAQSNSRMTRGVSVVSSSKNLFHGRANHSKRGGDSTKISSSNSRRSRSPMVRRKQSHSSAQSDTKTIDSSDNEAISSNGVESETKQEVNSEQPQQPASHYPQSSESTVSIPEGQNASNSSSRQGPVTRSLLRRQQGGTTGTLNNSTSFRIGQRTRKVVKGQSLTSAMQETQCCVGCQCPGAKRQHSRSSGRPGPSSRRRTGLGPKRRRNARTGGGRGLKRPSTTTRKRVKAVKTTPKPSGSKVNSSLETSSLLDEREVAHVNTVELSKPQDAVDGSLNNVTADQEAQLEDTNTDTDQQGLSSSASNKLVSAWLSRDVSGNVERDDALDEFGDEIGKWESKAAAVYPNSAAIAPNSCEEVNSNTNCCSQPTSIKATLTSQANAMFKQAKNTPQASEAPALSRPTMSLRCVTPVPFGSPRNHPHVGDVATGSSDLETASVCSGMSIVERAIQSLRKVGFPQQSRTTPAAASSTAMSCLPTTDHRSRVLQTMSFWNAKNSLGSVINGAANLAGSRDSSPLPASNGMPLGQSPGRMPLYQSQQGYRGLASVAGCAAAAAVARLSPKAAATDPLSSSSHRGDYGRLTSTSDNFNIPTTSMSQYIVPVAACTSSTTRTCTEDDETKQDDEKQPPVSACAVNTVAIVEGKTRDMDVVASRHQETFQGGDEIMHVSPPPLTGRECRGIPNEVSEDGISSEADEELDLEDGDHEVCETPSYNITNDECSLEAEIHANKVPTMALRVDCEDNIVGGTGSPCSVGNDDEEAYGSEVNRENDMVAMEMNAADEHNLE